jgi:gamma-glutamylcyclotransferase (GGCT)/AIG2-like uncharacterized protein YtfP
MRATAMLDNGQQVQCWMYAYNRNPGTAPLISDGDYNKHLAA